MITCDHFISNRLAVHLAAFTAAVGLLTGVGATIALYEVTTPQPVVNCE